MHKIYSVEKVQMLPSIEILFKYRNIIFLADGVFSCEKIAAQEMEKKKSGSSPIF